MDGERDLSGSDFAHFEYIPEITVPSRLTPQSYTLRIIVCSQQKSPLSYRKMQNETPTLPLQTIAPEDLAVFISAAQACASQMLANSRYISEQLPTLSMPEETRDLITVLCEQWISTKHDIISQLADIETLYEEGADAHEIAANCELALGWSNEAVEEANELLKQLTPAGTVADGDQSLIWMLVAESATNVITACNAAYEARPFVTSPSVGGR
jgi:hypothetical protein